MSETSEEVAEIVPIIMNPAASDSRTTRDPPRQYNTFDIEIRPALSSAQTTHTLSKENPRPNSKGTLTFNSKDCSPSLTHAI